ncbi:MAG: hypothetical protein MJE63_17655 [Proteobacteria bacterium]|nr:hypothetical protein [Pseudomonadota bacterium]
MATIKDELVKELKSNEHIVQIFPLEDFVTKQETGQKFSSWDHLKTQKRPNTPRYNFIPEWEDTKPIARFGAQYASVARDAEMARRLAREFGMAGRVMIKRWGGKAYVVFKGHPGNRTIFRAPRYSVSNPKIVRMAVGPKGIVESVKGGFVLTVVLCTTVNVFDYFIRDTATLAQLLGNVTSDLIKIGICSIAAATAGLIAGTAVFVPAVTLLVVIMVGVGTGFVLNSIDKQTGATKMLIEAYEEAGISLNQMINDIKSVPSNTIREQQRWEQWFINRAMRRAIGSVSW